MVRYLSNDYLEENNVRCPADTFSGSPIEGESVPVPRNMQYDILFDIPCTDNLVYSIFLFKGRRCV